MNKYIKNATWGGAVYNYLSNNITFFCYVKRIE